MIFFIIVMRLFYALQESARIKSITLTTAKTHSHAYARALFLMAWYLHMYKKKERKEEYEPGGHDNEGAIYRAAIASVVKVQLWD